MGNRLMLFTILLFSLITNSVPIHSTEHRIIWSVGDESICNGCALLYVFGDAYVIICLRSSPAG